MASSGSDKDLADDMRRIGVLRLFDLDDLLILRCFAIGHNVSATGKVLGLTQPAISQRVRRMEETFEVELFQRLGQRIEFTPEGKEFSQSAVTLVAAILQYFWDKLPPGKRPA